MEMAENKARHGVPSLFRDGAEINGSTQTEALSVASDLSVSTGGFIKSSLCDLATLPDCY
jgi:hypothetical protein